MKAGKKTILATALMATSITAFAGTDTYSIDVIVADKIEGQELQPQKINYSASPEAIKGYFEDNDIPYETLYSGEHTVDGKNQMVNDLRYPYQFDEAQYERGGKYTFDFDANGNIDIEVAYNSVYALEEGNNNLYLDMETYTMEDVMTADAGSLVMEMEIKDKVINNIVKSVSDRNGNSVIDRTHYLLVNRK